MTVTMHENDRFKTTMKITIPDTRAYPPYLVLANSSVPKVYVQRAPSPTCQDYDLVQSTVVSQVVPDDRDEFDGAGGLG
jgi:hypothetical protein